jgi:hypothetical protein
LAGEAELLLLDELAAAMELLQPASGAAPKRARSLAASSKPRAELARCSSEALLVLCRAVATHAEGAPPRSLRLAIAPLPSPLLAAPPQLPRTQRWPAAP